MQKISKIVSITVDIAGQLVTAYPVSPERLAELKIEHPDIAGRLDDCECGREYCIGGFWHICAEGPSGRCELFASDWQCNDSA